MLFKQKKKYIKPYLLYYQLLCGNGIHIVLWFQCHLIFLSILFLIVIFADKKKAFIILIVIGVNLYIFLSSNYYTKYLSYRTILFFSIRQFPLSYIYSLVGFILFKLNEIVKFKRYKMKNSFICLIVLCLYIP